MDKLQEAIARATKLHEWQTRRDWEPYINHVMRVYENLIDNYDTSKEWLIVAVLHDTIEDWHTTYEEIERRFWSDIARYVNILTRKQWQYYEDYIYDICMSYPLIARIKFLDICDNLTKDITKKKRKFYITFLIRLTKSLN